MIDDPLNRLSVKRGSELPHAKLTERDVENIREIVRERESEKARLSQITNAKLAEKYGVHVNTIHRITAGENWGHV